MPDSVVYMPDRVSWQLACQFCSANHHLSCLMICVCPLAELALGPVGEHGLMQNEWCGKCCIMHTTSLPIPVLSQCYYHSAIRSICRNIRRITEKCPLPTSNLRSGCEMVACGI